MFYEDLYKAFIFYVEHPRKVFMYKLFMCNIEKNMSLIQRLRIKNVVLKSDGKAKIVVKIYKNLHKEMDEEVRESKIEVEVELHQEKVDFINHAYEKGLR